MSFSYSFFRICLFVFVFLWMSMRIFCFLFLIQLLHSTAFICIQFQIFLPLFIFLVFVFLSSQQVLFISHLYFLLHFLLFPSFHFFFPRVTLLVHFFSPFPEPQYPYHENHRHVIPIISHVFFFLNLVSIAHFPA